jgi:hypothetical protein
MRDFLWLNLVPNILHWFLDSWILLLQFFIESDELLFCRFFSLTPFLAFFTGFGGSLISKYSALILLFKYVCKIHHRLVSITPFLELSDFWHQTKFCGFIAFLKSSLIAGFKLLLSILHWFSSFFSLPRICLNSVACLHFQYSLLIAWFRHPTQNCAL